MIPDSGHWRHSGRCLDWRSIAEPSTETTMGAPEAFTRSTDIGHFIGGQAVPATSGRSQAVYNPATGAVSCQVQLASVEDVNAAVAAAAAAFPAWADTPPIR